MRYEYEYTELVEGVRKLLAAVGWEWEEGMTPTGNIAAVLEEIEVAKQPVGDERAPALEHWGDRLAEVGGQLAESVMDVVASRLRGDTSNDWDDRVRYMFRAMVEFRQVIGERP